MLSTKFAKGTKRAPSLPEFASLMAFAEFLFWNFFWCCTSSKSLSFTGLPVHASSVIWVTCHGFYPASSWRSRLDTYVLHGSPSQVLICQKKIWYTVLWRIITPRRSLHLRPWSPVFTIGQSPAAQALKQNWKQDQQSNIQEGLK